jgi:two-component system NtrC family response regulator
VAEAKVDLLIVEDDAAALRQLGWTFDDYRVAKASDRSGALDALQRRQFPVALLDLGLPPDEEGTSEGIAALQEIVRRSPYTKVIVVTGREEREHALKAIELGAYDFYRKPVDPPELRFLVERALRLQQLEAENRRLSRAAKGEALPGVIGMSESITNACRLVARAAPSDISVLLLGESGTGKEVLARALHALSPRSEAPFVAINCAAIPEPLLESELFGHERGAFTGAVRASVGHIELAHGGTLFLDEIGDMPLALQAKLLRFLQERSIQRVGGRNMIHVDVRLVSATNRDIEARVRDGGFREDCYYRLAELSIEIAPLRDRVGDAVLLAQHFFERFREESTRPVRGLSPDAVAAIARYAWPGNVRELESRMRRAVVLADGTQLTTDDLDLADGTGGRQPLELKAAVSEAERQAVTRAWAEAGGNVSKASRLLGVSRPTVYNLLRDHGLKS